MYRTGCGIADGTETAETEESKSIAWIETVMCTVRRARDVMRCTEGSIWNRANANAGCVAGFEVY